jgi:hypothetical protein
MSYPNEFVFDPLQIRLSHLAETNMDGFERAPFLLYSPSLDSKNGKIKGVEKYFLNSKECLIFCGDSRGGLSVQKLSKDNDNFFLNSFDAFPQRNMKCDFENIDKINHEKLIKSTKKRKYITPHVSQMNDPELDDIADGELEKIEKKIKNVDLSRFFKKKILKKNKIDEKFFQNDNGITFEQTLESTQDEKIRFLKNDTVCLEDLIFAQTNEDLKNFKSAEILNSSNREFNIDEELLKRLKNSWDC